MKHIVAPLIWVMVLVGVLVEYGSYVSQLPHLQANADSEMGSSKSITGDRPSYNGVFTNSSGMTTLR